MTTNKENQGLSSFFTDIEDTTTTFSLGKELADEAGLHGADNYRNSVKSDNVAGLSKADTAAALKNNEASQLADILSQQDEGNIDHAAPLNPEELAMLRSHNIKEAITKATQDYDGLTALSLADIESELPNNYRLSSAEISAIEDTLNYEAGVKVAQNFAETGIEAAYRSAAEEHDPRPQELEQQRLQALAEQQEIQRQQQLALQELQREQQIALNELQREQEQKVTQPTPGMSV